MLQKEGVMDSLLTVKHISKIYETGIFARKSYKILNDISLDLKEGETLALVGESGAGKSTLVRIIMQLIRPTSGKIFYQGEDLMRLSGNRLRQQRQTLQMLFQNPISALNPRMTIRESMEEPIKIYHLSLQDLKRIPILFDRFQLRNELLERYPQKISGGEIQRVCLARLLLLRPKLLILDEPTSMLDASVQAQIIGQLKEIQEETGISYLFISHDLGLVKVFSHRIGILHKGKLVELQKTEDLYKNPQNEYTRDLISAYENL